MRWESYRQIWIPQFEGKRDDELRLREVLVVVNWRQSRKTDCRVTDLGLRQFKDTWVQQREDRYGTEVVLGYTGSQ